jgi:hypothetical protein
MTPTMEHQDITESIRRIDALRESEIKRIDEKFKDSDIKYQIQFNAAKEALGIALIAQEKATAAALEGTKEAITKADVATDKRFELLSEKIDGVSKVLSQNTGAQGIYVTHADLSVFGEKLQTSFEEALKPLVSQVNTLTAAQNSMQGRSSGFSASWGIIIGAVGLTSTIILLGLRLSGK